MKNQEPFYQQNLSAGYYIRILLIIVLDLNMYIIIFYIVPLGSFHSNQACNLILNIFNMNINNY